MKLLVTIVLVGTCCLGPLGRVARGAVPGAGDVRTHVPLSGQWKFLKADEPGAEKADADDAKWETVSVPHTWNALDGQDGGDNYLKAACWYRRHVALTPQQVQGKSLFLRFEGANRRSDVFVNGERVGSHLGGFGAFCFDVTKALRAGDNVLAVRVSNKPDPNSPPLSADFTFFGGVYRPVELLALPPVHISPVDYASPGVAIRTPEVNEERASVVVTALVQNEEDAARDARVAVEVRDAAGGEVARAEVPVRVEAGKTQPAEATLAVARPHRWNGRKDPYLYTVAVTVLGDGGSVLDRVTQPLGLRTFSVDEKRGFILNGEPYDLHGVNRHQDRLDKGWAISDDDIREDFALMKELGCTALRLSHYQQADLMYRLADEAGIVVWAEVPVVNNLGDTPAFTENAHQQLEELVRQNRNHPSICFWSMGNEVTPRKGDDPGAFFREMSDLAKKEDPGRLTTVAWRPKYKRPEASDVYGQNPYFGWYDGTWEELEPWLEKQPPRMAVTEYGAGASIYFHSENPVRMDHTEEYQALLHEASWAALKRHPEVWGKFIWAMFDFAVDSRKEGDHAGRNDKGLVTYDRKTRKDAFYFYQANWSEEPMLHLCGKRFAVRGRDKISVRAYSNAPEVELLVNGASLGRKAGDGCVFVWDGVPLKEGENRAEARASGRNGSAALHDQCTWTYKPGAPAEVYVAQDDRMRAALEKGPPRAPAAKKK